jgi:hypothetical protein
LLQPSAAFYGEISLTGPVATLLNGRHYDSVQFLLVGAAALYCENWFFRQR